MVTTFNCSGLRLYQIVRAPENCCNDSKLTVTMLSSKKSIACKSFKSSGETQKHNSQIISNENKIGPIC